MQRIEDAYNENQEKIKKLVPELSEKAFIIVRGEGSNSDQSEQSLRLKIAEYSSDYSVYDSFWGMTEAGKYISLAIMIEN